MQLSLVCDNDNNNLVSWHCHRVITKLPHITKCKLNLDVVIRFRMSNTVGSSLVAELVKLKDEPACQPPPVPDYAKDIPVLSIDEQIQIRDQMRKVRIEIECYGGGFQGGGVRKAVLVVMYDKHWKCLSYMNILFNEQTNFYTQYLEWCGFLRMKKWQWWSSGKTYLSPVRCGFKSEGYLSW